MTKNELNNTVTEALKNGSKLNNAIIATIKEMLQAGDNLAIDAMLFDGAGIPITIVRRQSNYKSAESHFEVCLSPELASGTFGSVYQSSLLVKANANGEIYNIAPSSKAVKLIKRHNEPSEAAILEKEKMVISDLYPNMNKPENIRKGRAHLSNFKTDKPYEGAFVMPYISGEELFGYLAKNWDNLSYEMRVIIACNIISAVDDFHKMTGKVHQDLKPDNMMIDPETLEITLVDFGMAEKIGTLRTVPCGSPNFVAPEVMSKEENNYSVKQDYFSLGGILAILLGSAESSRRVSGDKNIFYQIINNRFNTIDLFSGMCPPVEEASIIIEHIHALIRMDPNKRPEDLNQAREDFTKLAAAKVELLCQKMKGTINIAQTALSNLTSSLINSNSVSQSFEYKSDQPLTFENVVENSAEIVGKKSKNMHTFFKQANSKLNKYLTNKHGDKNNVLNQFKRKLEDAEFELLDNPTIEGYNKAYSQLLGAINSLDAKTMNELNQFRTISIKSIVAKLAKPVAWLLGKDSLLHTTSSNLALDIKDEFRIMAEESRELPRPGR